MTKKTIITTLLAIAAILTQAATKQEADALYEKEDYTAAARTYETLLSTQGEAYEVYYNLGNCYYKLDDIPHAILNYERALTLSPGDDDIRANLALARGKTTDKAVPASEMFFVTWWHNLVNLMSINSWSTLGVISFILMLIGILAYIFVSTLTIRKIGAYGAMTMLLLCIIANLAALTQNINFHSRNAAIVMQPSVTIKSSPSEKSTDLFVIHEGAKVLILDASMTEWLEVKFEEGKQGWVLATDVEII